MTTPSSQQQAFFDWIRTGSGSLVLEALAGTGKTTTLVGGEARDGSHIPGGVELMKGDVAIVAFNKKIADELTVRLAKLAPTKSQRRAGTFHSFGYSAWRRVAPGVQLKDKKVLAIVDWLVEEKVIAEGVALPVVAKLVSLAKQNGAGFLWTAEDEAPWRALIDHHDLEQDIENGDVTAVVLAAQAVLKQSIADDHHVIDFDDMIFAPLVHNIRVNQWDWVLVDEAQDLNPARQALARKMLKPGGRLVAVGDRHQAIYGFTGADARSLDSIAEDFNCSHLPLTLTYRCPKAVVAEANRIVPALEAHESNGDGIVRSILAKDLLAQTLAPTDAILCRNTKPLVALAYQFIRQKIGCRVEGREIGKGLIALATKWRVRNLADLAERLTEWKEREVEKAVAKGQESKAQAIEDKVDTLMLLIEQVQIEKAGGATINDLVAWIDGLFADSNGEQKLLTLSTVHKSKGREWGRVFVYGANLYMPSPWARKEWQQEQESNLIYVAITRAKQELVWVAVDQPAQ